MKRLFRMTFGERIGSLILLLLIGLVILCNSPQSWNNHSEESFFIDSAFHQRVEDYIATMSYQEYPRKTYESETQKPAELFPFDPNIADSSTFIRLGLPPFIAGNIIKYRNKGGVFKRRKDFSRIYGIDSAKYALLHSYIHIDSSAFILPKDSIKRPQFKSTKFKEVQKIEINKTDTSVLRKIPGIGAGYAQMIISYRNRLGGFYSCSQLNEIEHIPDSVKSMLKDWLIITSSPEQKLQINRASMEKLYSHPYINFYQAKAIYEIRKKRGTIRHINELSLLTEFTETDLERLSHYFVFTD